MALLETRHRIVHRHLPSLAELKRAARESLDWLWEWYWSQLDYAFSVPRDEEESMSVDMVREKLSVILRTYVKERKNEIKAKKPDLKAVENALSTYRLGFTAAKAPVPSPRTQRFLLQLLINEKMILPVGRKIGSSMSGAFLIWTPFLLAFCTSSPKMCMMSTLLTHFIQAMNEASISHAVVNKEMAPIREGMHDWLIHMLTSDEWLPARREAEPKVMEDVLASCFSEPTFWNLKVTATLLSQHNVPNQKQWLAVLDAARNEAPVESKADVEVDAEAMEVVEANATEQALSIQDIHDKEKAATTKEKTSGPQKVLGLWKPRPIGWLPDGWEDE